MNASASRLKGLRFALVIGLASAGFGGAADAMVAPAPLPSMNTKESRAEKIWTMRAALNVAALQCQFSPFLQTVPTYNALLRHHSDEMADSFKSMTGYFVRQQGPRVGQRAFDSYATRTNQSWATFDAQVQFCNKAAMIGRKALYLPKGKFGEFAETEMASLRESLQMPTRPAALEPRLEWAVVPQLSDPCKNKRRCK